jgi:predicted N-acyltransferase
MSARPLNAAVAHLVRIHAIGEFVFEHEPIATAAMMLERIPGVS